MQPQVFCLGSINVDLVYRVDDLAGFLQNWGTGLTRGGRMALTPAAEARLPDLLDKFAQPTDASAAARRPTPPTPWRA